MSESLPNFDHFIHHEMLAHPVLFTHPQARKLVVIGDNSMGVVQEAIKHSTLQEIWQVCTNLPENLINDPRLKVYVGETQNWLSQVPKGSQDILIFADQTVNFSESLYAKYLTILASEGMVVQLTESAFALSELKNHYLILKNSGFSDIQILHYPQPSFPLGWRAALLAVKQGMIKRIREKDIFNKTFNTRYYNYDVHKAALVMPEFMREEFEV